jgi:recombination protein RecA
MPANDLFNTLLEDKNLGFVVGNSEEFLYEKIPFNIPALDRITNGGIPKKKFSLFFGGWSSGKSYLASQLCKTVQSQDGVALWVDTEMSWDSVWMEKCGLDTESILVKQASNAEDAYRAMEAGLKNGADLVILDSVAGLIPEDITENKDSFGYSPIAWQARSWNQALIRLLPLLSHGSALVVINQVRGSMGPVSAIETMPGGKGQQFFAHAVMETRRGSYIKEKDERVGFMIKAGLLKDKFGGERWEQVEVPFRIEGGIDTNETYLREALEKGIITKRGAWYYCDKFPDQRIQGFDNLRAFADQFPEEMKKIVDAVQILD